VGARATYSQQNVGVEEEESEMERMIQLSEGARETEIGLKGGGGGRRRDLEKAKICTNETR